jgi:protein-S-isoprenylcysteine O-methyltransferase Ste14
MPRSEAAETLEALRPIGYVAFMVTLVLIILGFAVRNRWLGTLGSVAFYLPTFGYLASTMFFLAGIGVLRAVWLPLLDLSPKVLRLGEIVCLPLWLLFGSLLVPVSCIIMALGLMVFTLGVFTWLYSKFKGLGIADFWIYKYSRHPQYLGFLIWSYGLILLTSCYGALGKYTSPPSFPWLISALAIVGIALHEELTMVKKYGDKYKKYMDKTPFMLPLPKKLSTIITAPVRIVTKKNLPESNKQIIAVLSTYLYILVLLSLPLQYFIKL